MLGYWLVSFKKFNTSFSLAWEILILPRYFDNKCGIDSEDIISFNKGEWIVQINSSSGNVFDILSKANKVSTSSDNEHCF